MSARGKAARLALAAEKRALRSERRRYESTAEFKARLSAIFGPGVKKTNPALVRGPKDRGYNPPEQKRKGS